MYVKRDNSGSIEAFSRTSIPLNSETGEPDSGWEECSDVDEITQYLESL